MTKFLSWGLLVVYLVMLVWLVLFKLKFNISPILDRKHSSLNLVPFAAPSVIDGKTDYREMIMNSVFFFPFGLLLSVNFKNAGFLSKLAVILGFSLIAEVIQYICTIGATDITDIITNLSGGFLGLILYDISKRYVDHKKLDKVIVFIGLVIFVVFTSVLFSHLFVR